MNLEQKRELLIKWKESGLSLPNWWRENADELNLPHLSTLYAWVKQLGFSTDPGAEVTNEYDEEPDEYDEEPDEMGDLDDLQEEDEDEETQDDEETQENSQGQEKNDEKEIDEEPEEDNVIAKDRIEQLAPSTVPEPVQPEKTPGVDESKTGIKPRTLVIICGAGVLGIGAYLLVRKIIRKSIKRRKPKPEQNTIQGGNPFAGYITIDDF